MGRWWRYKWITFHPSLTPGFGVYCYAHFSLAIIGCKGSQNLIRM
ncbi:iso-IS1 ORF2 [Yersinia pestis Angola]|nr:iso-IS1 ORF2 [Yersinia pestis Angola]